MPQKARRFLGLLLVLTLVVGGAAQHVQAADMDVKMSAASASDMPMSDNCSGCDEADDDGSAACFAVCGNAITAIIGSPPTLAPGRLAIPVASLASSGVGQHGPPDPYPPRSASLN